MCERFIQCPECQAKFTSSNVIDGLCPECGNKSLTYGFLYVGENNELICSNEDLPVPHVSSIAIPA